MYEKILKKVYCGINFFQDAKYAAPVRKKTRGNL